MQTNPKEIFLQPVAQPRLSSYPSSHFSEPTIMLSPQISWHESPLHYQPSLVEEIGFKQRLVQVSGELGVPPEHE